MHFSRAYYYHLKKLNRIVSGKKVNVSVGYVLAIYLEENDLSPAIFAQSRNFEDGVICDMISASGEADDTTLERLGIILGVEPAYLKALDRSFYSEKRGPEVALYPEEEEEFV